MSTFFCEVMPNLFRNYVNRVRSLLNSSKFLSLSVLLGVNYVKCKQLARCFTITKASIVVITLIFLLSACNETGKLSGENVSDVKQNIPHNFFEFISSLKVPDKLSWCNEYIPMSNPEVKERAEREFYLFLQQPGQIILYLKRSARYFPMFEKIISEYKLPEDLKYLSVAESGLYMSFSEKGAAGLWQFIPSTAKILGLQVDEYIDERLHPEKSTIAAMKYLKQGYELFGSWMMTAAGYNMGHTNLYKSSEFQKKNDYFDLFLNPETSRFIFRIALIKEIMYNAEKYGFRLDSSDFYRSDKIKKVIWKDEIEDLSAWSESQGTTYKFVKILNPWIVGRKLPKPSKNQHYEILLPD